MKSEPNKDVARLPHRPRLHWRLLVALLLGAGLVWTQRVLSQWVDQTWVFVSFLALVGALLILLDWVVEIAGPPASRLLSSVARSVAGAVSEDPEVLRAKGRHPRLFGVLHSRLTLQRASGLYLTLMSVSFAYFFGVFLSIALDIATASTLTRYDNQVSAMLRSFRTPALSRFLWVFTVLGDVRVALVLALVAVGLLLLWGRRLEALLFGVAVAGGSLISAVAKYAFHRIRPDAAFALIKTPGSFSFPSGHALHTIIFMSCLVVVLAPMVKGYRLRIATWAMAGFVVVMTGLSRVYLGVHWMSDVFASWMLGLAWLSLCIGGYAMLKRYRPIPPGEPVGRRGARAIITIVTVSVLAVVVVGAAQADPLLERVSTRAKPIEIRVPESAAGTPRLTAAIVRRLPNSSQKLDGTAQEPIGLIFLGSRSDLVGAYRRAGWQLADRPSFASLARASVAALSNAPYPNAPVTPSFVGGRVEDLAFEKAIGRATIRKRHHCRWWQTQLVVNGLQVWVATASLDSRLEIGAVIPIPTHHIAPDIDAEQRFEVSQLEQAGLKTAQSVRVSPRTGGTNSAGDPWFTDGIATVLAVKR